MNAHANLLAVDKPRNGLAGLKHWRQDTVAGLMVSLVSLPFSLAIAVASGAPPVAGLISAIIAGLIYPFLGGSFVTISGPAAGLAPTLLAAITALGAGDPKLGYPLVLCVICSAGVLQIVLSLFKAARFSALFPSAVVEGMLAAIGLLIIAKELPYLLGHEFQAHGFFPVLLEIPSALAHVQLEVFLLGAGCLALLFALGSTRLRLLKAMPAPLLVVLAGVGLGQMLGLDARFMIRVPDGVFDGFTQPDFAVLLSQRQLWWAAATGILALTMIDTVESLATIAAIDKIDPYKRKSSPNRTLLAMGISKICSGMVGGLTIIPGGVKSTVCVVTGGRTLWANFYNAVFLILYLVVAAQVINLIPFSALAAVVIYIGWKLCEPRVWRHINHIGREQLLVFSVTVLVTLLEDLLVGICAGILAKLVVATWFTRKALVQPSRNGPNGRVGLFRQAGSLFRDPVTRRLLDGTIYHLHFDRPLVSFNLLHVQRELAAIPAEAKDVYLHIGDGVSLIDHTSCETLIHFTEEYEHLGRGRVRIVGLQNLARRSQHPSCMRVALPDGIDAEDPLVDAGFDLTGREEPTKLNLDHSSAGQEESWAELNRRALLAPEQAPGRNSDTKLDELSPRSQQQPKDADDPSSLGDQRAS